MASKLGFKSFVMKDSSRFLLDKKFPVYNKSKEIIHDLEPSVYSEIKFIDRNAIKNYKTIMSSTSIDCQALKDKEVYIDAFGKLFPCCYLAMIPYVPTTVDPEITDIRYEISNEYQSLVQDLGGIDRLDAEQMGIRNIIDSDAYQSVWNQYWNEKKLITCTRSCGVTDTFSKPVEQFITTETL